MSRPARTSLVALAVALLGLVVACSDDSEPGAPGTGTLSVIDVTVDRPANPNLTAVRLRIVNDTPNRDTLLSVDSPVAEDVTVHRSMTDDEGRSTMGAVDEVPVPARSTVTFEPGGLHVMLDDLTTDLAVGDEVPLTFTFTRAGTISVTGIVTEAGGQPEEHHD